MMAMNLAAHGTQDMYPTFLLRQRGFTVSQRSFATGVSMIGAIIGGTLFGLLSDRFGRRRSMIVALTGAIAAIPLWAYSGSMGWIVFGAFTMQFMVQGAWGVVPAHLTELSPDSVRGFLPGFGYQMGVLLASPVNYAEAIVARHTSYAAAMSMMAGGLFCDGYYRGGFGKGTKGRAIWLAGRQTGRASSGGRSNEREKTTIDGPPWIPADVSGVSRERSLCGFR